MAGSEKKIEAPFGLWNSPITARLISQRKRLEDVQWSRDGETLLWVEGRGDRSVLVSRREGDAARDLADEPSIRGTVGYGGGEFTAADTFVIFAGKDGRLYRQDLGSGAPHPITPAYGSAAAPALSPDDRQVAYVFSDGREDLLAVADSNGSEWPAILARGADFYMQPAWHPEGRWIAWVEWDHPNMPWDGTRLKLGRLDGAFPRVVDVQVVAGDHRTPVQQPQFSPDGRWLSYILGNGEWDDLVLLNLETSERRVLVHGEKFHLAQPAWVQGMRFHQWNASSSHIYTIRNVAGVAECWRVDITTGEQTRIDTAPYTWITQLSVSPQDEQLAFLASSPANPDCVARWDGSRLWIEAYTGGDQIGADFFPAPLPINWFAPDRTMVYGIFYPPTHPHFNSQGLPPVILNVHGGPTSQRTQRFDAERVYFTSRGYGWLDVNYRGSTGYGRVYQNALRERWGAADVEDAAGGAQALVQQALGDSKRMIIMGGSAGGYTVLNTLIRFSGRFRAGICLYGVSDLFSLAMETHKFEAHYEDSLVGRLPEASSRYQAYSPLFHADQIRDPLAIFQGADDRVVPPNQSEAIVKVLKERGVPHIYQLYAGEGHGFRKEETISDFLARTEKFLKQHVLFAP